MFFISFIVQKIDIGEPGDSLETMAIGLKIGLSRDPDVKCFGISR